MLRVLPRLAQGLLTAGSGYLAVLTVAAARPSVPSAPATASPLRTVVLVPAHDEEAQIEATVQALLAQAYPARALTVVVVADNCSDATARVAAAAGAEVWERTASDERGKGQALAWAVERVWSRHPDTELVLFVDADCAATPNLVAAAAARVGAGAAVVQADYAVANPEATGATARRWAGFALRHRVRGAGKTALGLSCGLFGTGMAFAAPVLRAHPWRAFSVAEDAEQHAALVRAGHRAEYATEAAVLSPMPTTEAAAADQQRRWESGNHELLATATTLVREGLARRDAQRLHTGLELLLPPQSVLAAGSLGFLGLSLGLRDRPLARSAAIALGAQAVHVLGGLAVARAPAPVWSALLTAPAMIARKLGQVGGIATTGGEEQWIRTTREP